jgi:hypothetical protein
MGKLWYLSDMSCAGLKQFLTEPAFLTRTVQVRVMLRKTTAFVLFCAHHTHTHIYIYMCVCVCVCVWLTHSFSCSYWFLFLSGIYNPYEFEPPHSWGYEITHKNTPQSVGLLWTSDQPVAETSTWQHTQHLTTDEHPCSRRDSNQQSQLPSGRRPSPERVVTDTSINQQLWGDKKKELLTWIRKIKLSYDLEKHPWHALYVDFL